MEYLLIGVFLIILTVFLALFYLRSSKISASQSEEMRQLKERLDVSSKEVYQTLERVSERIAERMDKITDQVGMRLGENVKAINESKSFLTQRAEHTERTVREVTNSLARLQEASEKMISTNQDILHFQQMLKVPKVRGGFGEILLENLLADSLPHEYYEMQYRFQSSGEVADAVIRLLDDHIVAIDAKFPLANFERVVAAENEEEKRASYKAFLSDVKKHIKDISDKYISPQENTLDLAFMYIPMEGIYYEMVVRRVDTTEDLWNFCLKHKVIPVSPNSFLSYLHTLLIGFRGLRIEKQTKEIIQSIGQVRKDFMKFQEDFELMGGHLTHAQNKYEDSAKRLERFNLRLEKIDLEEKKLELDTPQEVIAEEKHGIE